MVTTFIKTDSHYTVNRKRVRRTIDDFLMEKRVSGDVEVSVSIVGDRMMKTLNKKYRNLDETTDVLSFPLVDASQGRPFVEPPDGVLRLGDIVLSYPQIVADASEEDKLVDDVVDELIVHGLNHLMGQHHE